MLKGNRKPKKFLATQCTSSVTNFALRKPLSGCAPLLHPPLLYLPTRLKKSEYKRDTRIYMHGFRISPIYNDSLRRCGGSIYFSRHPVDWMHHTPSDVIHWSAARTAVKGNCHRRRDRRRRTGKHTGHLFCMCIWTRVSFKYLYLKFLYTHIVNLHERDAAHARARCVRVCVLRGSIFSSNDT